jgi:hypothetical protein
MNRLVLLSALTLGSFAAAHATPITGTLSIGGTDTYTAGNPGTVTFGAAAIGGGPGANTLTFSGLTNGNAVELFPSFGGAALPYTIGDNQVPAAISPVLAITTTEAGITYDFYMTDYNAMLIGPNAVGCQVGTCLDITGDGFFSVTGYDNTPGAFTFTTQLTPGQTSTTFSASALASPVPEPASLALVGSSLIGFAGMARRKLKV